jgi:hypothetical protein
VRAHRPGGAQPISLGGRVVLEGAAPSEVPVRLDVSEHATFPVRLPGGLEPGLHRATLRIDDVGETGTGFWVFDPAVFASGDALTFDGQMLRRNGVPEPLVGTTTMSASVHRDFLFEPDAAVWDDTFAELSSLNRAIAPACGRAGSGQRGRERRRRRFSGPWRVPPDGPPPSPPVIFSLFAFTPGSSAARTRLDPRAPRASVRC